MGTCSSASGTVRHSDDVIGGEPSPLLERDQVIDQHMEEFRHHLADLTSSIQQLKDNATNKDEQIDNLKQDQHKLKNDFVTIRSDFENLRSEMDRKPTSSSITMITAERVHAGDVTYIDRSKTNYTANEMFADNSIVNKKETNISIKENTATRTNKEDKVPILQTPVVHAAGTANYAKTTNSYTASEILEDSSNVTSFNSKEKHNSFHENNETRAKKSDQVSILQADPVDQDPVYGSTVPVADSSYHKKTTDNSTASEILVNNSNVAFVKTNEKHNSVNENDETRADKADQIPNPRPKWNF